MAEMQPSHARASLDPDRSASVSPANRESPPRGGPVVIAVLVVVLIVLYQDIWFWESDYLVLGFMPIGLFYHAVLSVAASLVWLLATRIAWPAETIRQAKVAAQSREAEA